MRGKLIPEPWRSFFSQVDEKIREDVELHCFGGFVVTALYGLARPTADVDVIMIAPGSVRQALLGLAGKGSLLHRKHGVYLDFVTIATVPEDYDQRLTEMFPKALKRLRLYAFDPYDLALAKLERNIQRDRDDVKHLARTIPLDSALLKAEYGLDVELIQIGRGAKAVAALIAGEVQVCQLAGASVIHAAAAGEDVVLIGGLYNTHLYSLMVRPEIASAADLKGKAVAISQPGSGSDSAMRAALRHLNLTPDKDVTLMMIGSQSERLAAMESGQIAGTLVSVPETVKAKEKGYRELLSMPTLNIPYPSGSIATTRRFISANRPAALNLMKAISTAIARMKQDQEGTYEVMAKCMKLDRQTDAATLAEGYAELVRKNLVDAPYPMLEGIAAEITAAAAENPNAAKLKPEDIVDASLVRELETTGFLSKLKQ